VSAAVRLGVLTLLDLVVRGGTVVSDRSIEQADVGVEAGRIAVVGREVPRGRRELDAAGAYVIPGAVDAHTHLNSEWPFEEERRPVDGFHHGTRAAAAGGVTTVCDFVYQGGDGDLRRAIDRVRARADAQAVVDYALHPVVTDLRPSVAAEAPRLVAEGFPSFKFYTLLPDFTAHGVDYLSLVAAIGQAGGLAMFHCEDPDILGYCRAEAMSSGRVGPRHYAGSRPTEIEAAATARAVRMGSVTGTPVYLVHLSCAEALEEAVAAKRRGARVFVETRPLYLYLTADAMEGSDAHAARYESTPPLRTKADRELLWSGLVDGDIDVVATDHVGFSLADKYRPGDTMDQVPKGVANLQALVSMLFSEGVRTGRLPLRRFVDLIATTPARIFGLFPDKGVIAIGSDADLCIIDPVACRPIDPNRMESLSDFDLFESFTVTGWPVCTVSRGEVVYSDGEVTAPAGRGRFVPGRTGVAKARAI
jgi:dihydropyrimidinase